MLGTDYGMHDPHWMSRLHSDERQVTKYRVGRVLRAGDAAHGHFSARGQDMNAGLQDAANPSGNPTCSVQYPAKSETGAPLEWRQSL